MAAPRILQLDTERGWRGGQLQVLLLQRGLCRLGIDSTLLCRADEPLAIAAAAEGLPVLAIRSGLGFALRAAWMARRFAAQAAGTILHAHASAAHGIGLPAGPSAGGASSTATEIPSATSASAPSVI